ncbi:MAG: 3-phosphoshikimate 1-carboxyvinyltransferase, partial [Bacillota bacterium]|nr:3-phosphoshikimate 1-carboxyvinyltransferase [Bacillota bacterium]
ISPGHYAAKGKIRVEKDYSQAAFWIVAELLRQLNGGDFRQILLPGMNPHSLQGDRVILDILGVRIEPSGRITRVREPRSQADLTHCPDLFPILSVFYALYEKGGTITGADRVSYKESDRYEAMRLELTKLGCRAVREGGKFRIYPGRLKGNICSAHDDHRVAMALLILSLFVDNVRLDSRECIGKSYPMFLEDLKKVMAMNNKKQ